jgi:hypothetical protein
MSVSIRSCGDYFPNDYIRSLFKGARPERIPDKVLSIMYTIFILQG